MSVDSAVVAAPERTCGGKRGARSVSRRLTLYLSLAVLAVWALVIVLGPWLIPYDPIAQVLSDRLQPPNGAHWFGTDQFGRDILSRIMFGARLSLGIAFVTALTATLVGTLLGILGAFLPRGGALILRLNDGMLAFPATFLAIALIAVIGRGAATTIIALAAVFAPQFVRISYGETRRLIEREFIDSARAAGCGLPRILVRHVSPYLGAATIVQATYVFAMAVLSEASLSFIGAGVPPPAPSWGTMINEGAIFIGSNQWLIFPVAAAMISAVLTLNVAGDRLHEAVDPRRSG